jgi:ribosomal protein S11
MKQATRDTNMSNYSTPTQAPKGGAVSPLNGEFYLGGQFMCNQFAMPKGYTKQLKRAVQKTHNSQNIATVTVSNTREGARVMVRMAGETRQECVFLGTHDQCTEFARQLIAAKAEQCERQGLMAHPTELVVMPAQ